VAIDRPSELEIRRALAECMTLGDIDDAMGWSPGTSRRRRWRPLERGGLPSADAELGGVALWFRSTFESWQHSRLTRGNRDRSSTAGTPPTVPGLELPVQSQSPEGVPLDPQPVDAVESARPAEPTHAAPSTVEAPHEQDGARPVEEGAESVDRPDDQPAAAAETEAPIAEEVDADAVSASDGEERIDDGEVFDQDELGPDEPATEEDLPVAESGFTLRPGQRVLADVHGRWREAWVGHRDRATVMVDYNLDGTPLGARQLRISVSRVRIPDDDQQEPPRRD
jgi:hypothetical protein